MTAPSEAGVAELVSAIVQLAAAEPITADLADRLRTAGSLMDNGTVTVVVAGETKRGKSSLLNALLGARDLLPVDTGVCTSTHVVIEHAESPHASVVTEEGARDVPIDEAAGWITSEDAVSVTIGIDLPLLRAGVQLVDTPGVGGLVSAHADITLAALRHADALVFVLDLAAPITKEELNFLVRAAERIDTVLVVLTRADLYDSEAIETIVATDRTLLEKALPRAADIPLLPVSTGPSDPDHDGMDQLRTELDQRVTRRGRHLREANTLRLALNTLAAVKLPEALILNAADDPTVREKLAAEQQRLQKLVEDRTDWSVRLGDLMQSIRYDAEQSLNRHHAQLRRKYDETIAGKSWKDDKRLPNELGQDIHALGLGIGGLIEDGARAAVERILDDYSLDSLDASVSGALKIELDTPSIESVRPDFMQFYFAQSSMLAGDRLAAGLGHAMHVSLGAALGPVGLLAGAAMGGLLLRSRLRQTKQQRARELIRSTLGDAVSEIRVELQRRVAQVNVVLRDALKATYERQLATVNDARNELERVAASDRTRQQERKALARRRLGEMHELETRIVAALAELSGPIEKEARSVG